MSALLAAWAFVPEGRTVAAGLLLGTAASVVNAFLLRRRVELIGRMAAEGRARRTGPGLGARLATVLLAVLVAHRFPDWFALPAVIAGCFFVQIAIFFAAIAQHKSRSGGKG
jgi:ATP synthase protein I